MDTAAFYKGKRVLVTGHTGFKGTWLCLLLERLGAETFGYALEPEKDSLYLAAEPEMTGEIFADIRDRDPLKKFLYETMPDVVIHLAAHAFLNGSYEIPAEIFEINVQGTVGLLDEIRGLEKHPATVVVTSDKCYSQENLGAPCREDAVLGAAEAYSSSKACQDIAAQCWQFSFPEFPVGIARASNVIGGGDFHTNRLVPYLLDSFGNGVAAKLRNPDFVRPWQYVLDVLWGYLTLGKTLSEGTHSEKAIFNFGPGEDGFRTVRETAEILASHFTDAKTEFGEANKSAETRILRLDSEKARKVLKWTPLYPFEETLAQTAGFAKQIKTVPIKDVCRSQIDRYLSRVSEGKT